MRFDNCCRQPPNKLLAVETAERRQKVMTTIGRKDLYERVWQTPMVRLAKEYGISDQGLAKICKRHAIPLPPRGHWVRKETGKTVVQVPLPDLPEGGSDQVKITVASKSLMRAMAANKREKAVRADIKSCPMFWLA